MMEMIKYGMLVCKKHLEDEKGQGMVEYGLIIGAIAVVVLVALTPLGAGIKTMFEGLVTSLGLGGA